MIEAYKGAAAQVSAAFDERVRAEGRMRRFLADGQAGRGDLRLERSEDHETVFAVRLPLHVVASLG